MNRFIQVEIQYVLNADAANQILREWQLAHPRRKIVNLNLQPTEPGGWFLLIFYEIEV